MADPKGVVGQKQPETIDPFWRVKLTPSRLPENVSTLSIEVIPSGYQLPIASKGDETYVKDVIDSARLALEVGDYNKAIELIDALNILPSNLISFQKQFSNEWGQLKKLLLNIATAIHNSHDGDRSNLFPYFAEQAKKFLRSFVIYVGEDNKQYAFISGRWERGLQPQSASGGRLCNPVILGTGGKNGFDASLIWNELNTELRTDANRSELKCYNIPNPVPMQMDVKGVDRDVGEQDVFNLDATTTFSGCKLSKIKWEQISGLQSSVYQQNGIWKIRTPQVFEDGQEINLKVTAENEFGIERSDEVAFTVNNTVNEAPSVVVKGPSQSDSGSEVKLQGIGNDPNPADHLKYGWRQVSKDGDFKIGFALKDDGRTLIFNAPQFYKRKVVTFELTVTDPYGAKAKKLHSVTILPNHKGHLADPEKLKEKYPSASKKIELLSRLGPIYAFSRSPLSGLAGRINQAIHENKPVHGKQIVLALDSTGSMSDDVEDLTREANHVKGELERSSKNANESDIGVVTFSDANIKVVLPLDPKRGLSKTVNNMQTALREMQFGGGYEYLADAIYLALQEIKKHGSKNPLVKKEVILITDENGDPGPSKLTIEKVKAMADSAGITVKTIFLERDDLDRMRGLNVEVYRETIRPIGIPTIDTKKARERLKGEIDLFMKKRQIKSF